VAVIPLRSSGASFATTGARGAIASISRTSAGIMVYTLSQGLPSANCRTTVAPLANCLIAVVHTSDTVKTVTTSTGTIASPVAADIDYDIEFGRVEP
jgi:hypothetical protein